MNEKSPAAVYIAEDQLDDLARRVAKRAVSELVTLRDGFKISDSCKQEIADLVLAKIAETAPGPISEEDKDDIAERVVTLLGVDEPNALELGAAARSLDPAPMPADANPASSVATGGGDTLDFIDPNAKPVDPKEHEQTK